MTHPSHSDASTPGQRRLATPDTRPALQRHGPPAGGVKGGLHSGPLAALLAATLLLGACGGGGGGGDSTGDVGVEGGAPVFTSLGCTPDLSVDITPGQRLLNNAWNRSDAGSFGWSQCLLRRTTGSEQAYGWQWTWPQDSTQVLAAPSIVIGARPWDGGAGNDARFPRRLADTPRLLLTQDLQSIGTGEASQASWLWFTRGAQTAATPAPAAVAAQLMVWSDYTPGMLATLAPATLRGEVTLEGRTWQVWAAERWGGGTVAPGDARWTLVVYAARGGSLNVDLRRFIDDALARNLLTPDLHIAALETGNQLVSGTGQTIVRALSVTTP